VAELWEQQESEGEPAQSYSRFLLYRSLGPGRNLDAAYRLQLQQAGEAPEGARRRQPVAPGNWCKDCIRWRWVERASAWDVHVSLLVGEHAIAAQLGLVDAMARRAQQKALRSEPRTWKGRYSGARLRGPPGPAAPSAACQLAFSRRRTIPTGRWR
jgi:hypothetical protein